ncbi:MAG TPA: class I SAM-dependent methyltransferase [Thermoanaerobaculia bacterium]|nr:class I SAM-dependent methyltransferase [Thermoanaerobaculia bacterium]
MSDRVTQLRHSWIANAARWTDAVRNRTIESRRLVTDAAIVDAILERRPRTVLDLGCGEGWLARALAAHGVSVTGVDASPALVDAAREKGGGTFHVQPYDRLALDGKYDVVAANFSLLEENLQPVFRALHPLTQDAMIIQTVHPAFVERDAPYVDGWREDATWGEPMPWYCRTVGSWLRLFRECGFAIESIREPLHPERAQPLSIVFVIVRT